MSLPTIQFQLTPQAQSLLAKVQQIPQRTLRGIARGMDLANQETVGVIQKQFLSYPKQGPTTMEGLRVITNRLRGSIRASKAVIQGDAVVSAIGSNVKYAAAHEFGFTGTVQVPAHTRRPGRSFMQGGKIISFRRAAELLTKSGKPRKKSGLVEIHETRAVLIDVRAHPMKVNLPARAPIRRGIIRNLERTRKIISSNVIKSLEAAA